MKVKHKMCAECGDKFEPENRWQKYDKQKCRQAAYRGRLTKILKAARRIIEDQTEPKP